MSFFASGGLSDLSRCDSIDLPSMQQMDFMHFCVLCWYNLRETNLRRMSFCYKRIMYFKKKGLINLCVLWFAAKLKFSVNDLSGSSCDNMSQPIESPLFISQDIPMIPPPENLYQIQKQIHLAKMINFTPMYGFFFAFVHIPCYMIN